MDGQLGRVGDVHGATLGVGMVHTDEPFPRPVGEQRHRTICLVPDDAHVASLPIVRPRFDSREAVRRHQFGRIDEARIFPGLHGAVRPPVVPMSDIGSVVQLDSLLEQRPRRRQSQFHPPAASIDLIGVADEDRSAPVGVLRRGKVDGRHRRPVVRDRIVELDSEGCPGSPVSDQRLLDRAVRVKHLLPGALVEAAVDVPPEVRQNGEAQILVLEVEGAPADDLSLVGQPIAQRVRIVETAEREEIERCVRIRRRLEVGGQLQRILPDSVRQAFPARRGAAPPHTRARAASQLVACQAQSGASATAQSSAKAPRCGLRRADGRRKIDSVSCGPSAEPWPSPPVRR